MKSRLLSESLQLVCVVSIYNILLKYIRKAYKKMSSAPSMALTSTFPKRLDRVETHADCSLMSSGVLYRGAQRLKSQFSHSSPSSTEVKTWVEPYIYCPRVPSCSGHSNNFTLPQNKCLQSTGFLPQVCRTPVYSVYNPDILTIQHREANWGPKFSTTQT
jgi:hypothetical protein